jgi:hypothetical protein
VPDRHIARVLVAHLRGSLESVTAAGIQNEIPGVVAALAIVDARAKTAEDRALLASVNITIALLVALLGRLINIKRDQILPASEEALAAIEALAPAAPENGTASATLDLQPWVEVDYRLALPDHTVFMRAGRQLDVVQLLTLLDFSLADLSHQVRGRNALVAELAAARTTGDGGLPPVALRRYAATCRDIARLTDENLFFIDKSIQKLRTLAQKSLPAAMHGGIADVGLRAETGPLMPPDDLIRTFE